VRFPCATHLIITGDSQELLEQEVRPLVEQFLKDRGLTLSPDKTRITHISEGFDFLGQNLRKYDGKPLVKPSKKNTHAFLEKVRGAHQGEPNCQPSGVDWFVESGHSWLGQLPPALCGQGDVQPGGPRNLARALAVGQTPTSQEITRLG
jgi:hypothetical protein